MLAIYLMLNFNKDVKAFIYNTYQLYLQDSPLRFKDSQNWLEAKNAQFAAKLVRGAYLSYESTCKISTHPNYVVCSSKERTGKL